jgi:hypothetical protein
MSMILEIVDSGMGPTGRRSLLLVDPRVLRLSDPGIESAGP